MEPVEALKKTLKWFAVTASRFQLITKNDKEKYVETRVENDNAVAGIQINEYYHTHDSNIKAIHMQVTAFSGAKELKKLENLGFLQVYSKEKQVLIYVDKILAKMKTWKESDGGDFSVRAFENIKNDKGLKKLPCDHHKFKHHKVNGEFKPLHNLKEKTKYPYVVLRKYLFESKEDKDIKYYVSHIIETTDKELEPFIGKCLVQKKDEKHQTITIPEAVFKFMLDNC